MAEFEGWAILELMGHRRLAGSVSEVSIAGTAFIRIDIPGHSETALATQFYSGAAIYCITPTTEDTAREVAQLSVVAPVERWELTARLNREVGRLVTPPEDWDDEPRGPRL